MTDVGVELRQIKTFHTFLLVFQKKNKFYTVLLLFLEYRSTSAIAVNCESLAQAVSLTHRRTSTQGATVERRPSVLVTPPPLPRESRSDGCLRTRAELHRSTNSLLSQHQQCCAGFQSSGKHSHSCDIV